MNRTNFDRYLEERLQDPAFAARFEQAGDAWDVALQIVALRQQAGLSQKERKGNRCPSFFRVLRACVSFVRSRLREIVDLTNTIIGTTTEVHERLCPKWLESAYRVWRPGIEERKTQRHGGLSSDEGLMREKIETCLRPVISAVAASSGGGEWAREMLRRDRTGCLCRQDLTELAERSMPEGNTGVATGPPSGAKKHCSN